jgi:hypothetical protein
MALKPSRQGCLRLYLYMALVSAVLGVWVFGADLIHTDMDARNVALWMALIELLLCIALFGCGVATLLGKRWGVLGLFGTAVVYLIVSIVEISLLPTGSFAKVASGVFLLVLLSILALPELRQPQASG